MKIAPPIAANTEILSSLMDLGASYFPVSIVLDTETGKTSKIPHVQGWQKTSSFSIVSKAELYKHAAFGFHPETIGAYVVDLDEHGAPGEAALIEALGEKIEEIEYPKVYVDTPNGRHLYFSREGLDDILYSRNNIIPGVDIRADYRGGWLIAPGSVGYSYKRQDWTRYFEAGDFSALPRMPDSLHALIRKLLGSVDKPDTLPAFIPPATSRDLPPIQATASDPKVAKLFELARICCRNPDIFIVLCSKFAPGASRIPSGDLVSADYSGRTAGSSCHWTPSNGLIKDFNDPGPGGDFIWWLSTHGGLSTIEAARTILSVAGFPDPSGGITLEDAKKEANEHIQTAATSSVSGSFPLTDSGNAERLVVAANEQILYNADAEQWVAWDGMQWHKEHGAAIQQVAKSVIRGMVNEVEKMTEPQKAKKLIKWAIESEGAGRREAMCKLARFEPEMQSAESDFDTCDELLNTLSGVINLRTGEILPHDKKYRITQICPYHISYDKPTRFLEFMYEIVDSRPALLDWLYIYLGYCLTGNTQEQLFPIWWGAGANGKSQLLNVIGEIMGSYCKPMAADTILNSRAGGSVRDDLASLKGARFVWASEPDAGKAVSISTIKLMTGGDPITCRHLYGRIFSYIPTFKPVFVTNHRPQVRSQDHGTWRRLRFIPFTYQVPEEKRIPNLSAQLLSQEGDKILGWLITGAQRWYEDKRLPFCAEIEAATQGLKDGDDPLAEFIMERCILSFSITTPFDQVWKEYCQWANDKNMRNTLPRSLFRRLLEERNGIQISEYAMRVVIRGVGIRCLPNEVNK